jgi:PAS domain-containing protein
MRSRPALSSPGIWPKTVVALDHAVLHLDGATHGVNYATKLNDAPVASALHRAPVMEGNSRVDEVAAEGMQPRKRPLLVCTSKFAVPGYICRKNGCKFPSLCHIRPFTTRQISTISHWPGQVVSPGQSSLARGIGCGALASNKRSRLLRYGIIEKVLPNLTAEHLKDPGHGDAIGLVRTDAKAKAALAIMAEFDKRLWEGGKMAQPIQIILMRRLAEYLSVPLFLVGPSGDLLFYNEPAEVLLGRRFDETGAMSAKEWSSAFTPEDSEGHPVPPEDVPLMITITKKRPAYQRFFIRGFDGVRRHVEVASIPIAGLDGDFLGGAALFWEVSD